MAFFDPRNKNRTARHQRIYALYEVWYTAVDFAAAGCFVIGSILFFSQATMTAATWMFLIGSLFFAAKPTLRLLREIKYLRMGKIDFLANRQKG